MLCKYLLRRVAAVALAGLSSSAFADIKTFNAAAIRGDYKAAAAAANETWPTLDKTRADLDQIAIEFGFAAVMAGDNSAARTFAQASIERRAANNAPLGDQMVAKELLKLAEHNIAPTAQTRQGLYDALNARVEHPGVDRISMLAANTLLAYDNKQAKWTEAHADSLLAIRLTTNGGAPLAARRRMLEVMEEVTGYLAKEDANRYAALLQLQLATVLDMAAAPDPATAEAYASAYWYAYAWSGTIQTHLESDGQRMVVAKMDKAATKALEEAAPESVRRQLSIFKSDFENANCNRRMLTRPKPSYPPSAQMKRYISTVMLQVDIDAQGRAINPKLLASAPESEFGEAVLKSIEGLSFRPGKDWDASKCKIETSGYVIRYVFRFD